MSLLYSEFNLLSTKMIKLNLRAYVMFIVDLFRTYRPPSLTPSCDGYHLSSVQRSPRYGHHPSEWLGVEPICLLLTWSFEETSLAWLHLLTLTKLGGDDWSWTSSAFRAADLQSTGVTNFPTSPKHIRTHSRFWCLCWLWANRMCSYMLCVPRR